jgi:Fe-S-cluster containining protein
MFDVEVDPASLLTGAVSRPDGGRRLRCAPDGCPHLSDQGCGRCSVYANRPRACRDFPFRVTETPGGVYVGASFACTAIAGNLGPKITDEAWDWSQYPVHRMQTSLADHIPGDWQDYLRVEEFLSDQFCLPQGTWTGALGVSLGIARGHLARLGQEKLLGLSGEVESAAQRTLRGLLALCEAGDDVQRAQQVLTCLAQGGRYWSQIFGEWVEPAVIWQHLETEDSEHWADVEPFFRHLLFRKFLWGPPSVHARVCLLPLLNEMLRYWSWQQALQKNQRPDRELRLEAIRELERRLTFHAHGWEEFVRPLSIAFLTGVR